MGLLRQPRQRLLSFCASSRGFRGLFRECLTSTVSGHLGVTAYQLVGVAVGNNAKQWPLPLTKRDVRRALAHLSRLRFVGLQEEWASSVALFHVALMPSIPVVAAEAVNIHETPDVHRISAPSVQQRHGTHSCRECQRYGEAELDTLPPNLQAQLALDPDQILYAYAVMVFCGHLRNALPPTLTHAASCHRPCPIVYVSPQPQEASSTSHTRGTATSFEERVRVAAKRLVAHWGFDALPWTPQLVASLRGLSVSSTGNVDGGPTVPQYMP